MVSSAILTEPDLFFLVKKKKKLWLFAGHGELCNSHRAKLFFLVKRKKKKKKLWLVVVVATIHTTLPITSSLAH
jgi:hypothetical protein